MKSMLAYLICTTALCAAPPSKSEAPRNGMNADWLRQGCAAVMLSREGENVATDKQLKHASQTVMYLKGFLAGASAMDIAIGESALSPPDKWGSISTVTIEVMAFMDEYKDQINGNADCTVILTAWYFLRHPNGDEALKSKGLLLLKRADLLLKRAEWLENYPKAPEFRLKSGDKR